MKNWLIKLFKQHKELEKKRKKATETGAIYITIIK